MHRQPSKKYRPFPPVSLPDRKWPGCVLTRAPVWCSVDLRDGNQALAVPMNVGQKLELFQTLVKIGFKEIEVGFPSASNTEFTFNRRLIEEDRAPEDVWLQVLVQAREDLIERTVESLVGAKKTIIHLYNSTSPAQRRVVFGLSRKEIIAVAVRGARWIQDRLPRLKGTEVMLQYSPESFSATEVEFAREISEAVMDVWQPTPKRKMILNLPDTVEVAMPNVYADQIEWMCRNIKNRNSLIVSVHTHNDRNTGVAATELGLLAGAERVEGTLFGNGERTGNLDIVTVALNLYQHGIDPKLDFTNLNSIIEVYERCTGMTVPPRQPYAGELVFTAFSGSHQDAIKKGLAEPFENFWKWLRKRRRGFKTFKQGKRFSIKADGTEPSAVKIIPAETRKEHKFTKENAQKVWERYLALSSRERIVSSKYQQSEWLDCPDRNSPWLAAAIDNYNPEQKSSIWDVPYLTVDPRDIGREYREVIRVNSQSGKGGVAYLLESEFGIVLPKEMQREFGPIANEKVDHYGREVSAAKLKHMFWREYVNRKSPWNLKGFASETRSITMRRSIIQSKLGRRLSIRAKRSRQQVRCRVELLRKGRRLKFIGEGNGPLAALVHGFSQIGIPKFKIINYSEHALSSGEGAAAIAYIQIKTGDGKTRWGAGVDTNIELASVRAVLSALNRS